MKKAISFLIIIVILLSVSLVGNLSVFATEDGFTVKPVTSNTAEIIGYDGIGGDLTVPENAEGYKIIGIGSKAFYQNKNISAISLPSSISYIGENAFAGAHIKSIKMENSVKSLGISAFRECVYLENIVLSNEIAEIPVGCFSSCTRLTEITIPQSVLAIGNGAFQNCYHLEKVSIPSSVKTIGTYAFASNYLLSEVTLSRGLEKIDTCAFFQCQALQSINIPESVKTISDNVFCDCFALDSVTLNEGLETIGTGAFDTCPVKEVKIPASVKTIDRYGIGYFYDQDMFEYRKNTDFKILCVEGTEGHSYALENEFPFALYEYTTPTEPTEPEVIPTEPSETAPTETDPAPSETTPSTPTPSDPTEANPKPSDTLPTAPEENFEMGDVNMDKTVNVKDSTLIQKFMASLANLSEKALLLADINSDGNVNIKDATTIQKQVAGI